VGNILGTPQYMSPVQAHGEKLDGRSDLFCAGASHHQMITGQRPLLSDGQRALAVKISHDDPQPIEKLRPGLPLALCRVIECFLANAPPRFIPAAAN
jgi:serine/threonine-protein kinase